ncbi:class I SAM-dependent RNA methyltransferase [Treponema pectinovorum]|uniref:class I SAM-dependent RNA methyltransferase n=1 Tax=Treponema pectinovorum TaxID=164 RepID=UPI0011CB77DD|nr:methyltransferase [Treponema pectinovorum]
MEKFTVVAEKMVAGGYCLAKLNGKNVFVMFTIPGEKIEIEITKDFKDYSIAKLIKVLEPSSHRVLPFCSFYGSCGGCNMQHIEIGYQRKLRADLLKDCFEREGIKIPEIKSIFGEEKNYRSRIQLTDGGLNERASNKVLPVDFCPIATRQINDYLNKTPQEQRPSGRVHFFGDDRVISKTESGFEKLVIADETKIDFWQQKQLGKSKKSAKNKVVKRFAGTLANSKNSCTVEIARKRIEFDVKGFFQSNMEILEKTTKILTKNLGGNSVLDFYSGCGTFSVFLADLFKKTVLVEHNRDALIYAEANLLGKPHETYGLSGKNWILSNAKSVLQRDGAFDAVVIDPPRSGMEKEVCQWLCKNKTAQIRSVSCDPSTHARDCAHLIKSGYKLTQLYLLDFYPQTAHIESLAFFEYV